MALLGSSKMNCSLFVVMLLLPYIGTSWSLRLKAPDEIGNKSGVPDSKHGKEVNGGKGCAICTVAVALSEQLAEIHNETIVKGLQRICSFLPDNFRPTCNFFLQTALPVLTEMFFDDTLTPDVACHVLRFCYTEPGTEMCHVFPPPSGGLEKAVRGARGKISDRSHKMDTLSKTDTICPKVPILKEMCEAHEVKNGGNPLPIVDLDSDDFSTIKSFRGSFWRGRDCNDFKAEFHPGARPINQDKYFDSDCNGIYGVDNVYQRPYEETLCSGTPRMGVAILGDSAGAHMHIPAEWFTATEIGPDAFRDIVMILGNDFDWPMTSAVTGYMNSTWSVLKGPTKSLYLRLRDLNHCNHRDYQNLGVNGAKSIDIATNGLSRDPIHDHPMMVIYSLVGNDVCNGHNDTIPYMTTEKEMKANFIKTLNNLDTRLPNGSFVIATSLGQGGLLYNILKNQVHPIGKWRQNVKYPDVYEYLNCLLVSPCNGWMTANESLRNFTSERAANLSKVLQRVASSYKAKHFRTLYVDLNFKKLIDEYVAKGGNPWDLIEPVDGFHPNQLALSMTSDEIWREIQLQIPDVIKTWTNPNNARIRSIFGDQGGY